VAAASDADGDEIADPFDNCPSVPNVAQEDLDDDRVGDACAAQTCGNDVREGTEACDGDDGSCAGRCLADCTCACANGVDGALRVDAARGVVRARLVVPMAAYDGEAATVRLDDADRAILARETVGRLAARGGGVWRHRTKGRGLRLVRVRALDGRRAGFYRVTVVARRWFAVPAGQAVAPRLTVELGSLCFAR
jgi:hypothetical protein